MSIKVRVLFWTIVLVLHGVLITWLAGSLAEPESAQPLPVLAVDMVSSLSEPQPAAPPSPPVISAVPSTPPAAAIRKNPSKAAPREPARRAAPPDSAQAQPAAAPATPPSAPAPETAAAASSAFAGPAPDAAPAPAPPTSTPVYVPAAYAASNRKPDYPALSRRYGEEGTVVLRVLVNAAGRAAQVDIHTSSGHALLDQSAQQAVRSWRFAPATRNGQPVPDWFLVPIPFKLHD